MLGFETIVAGSRKKDREFWEEKVDKLDKKDIFFTTEYAKIFEESLGYKAQLFFHGNDQNYIIFPFLKSRIRFLPYYNIISMPYEYGGIVANLKGKSMERELFKGFLSELHNYCVKNKVVGEYVNAHPFIRDYEVLMKYDDMNGKIIDRSRHLYIILPSSVEELWRGFKYMNRKNIKRSQRFGVEVRKTEEKRDIKKFYELYLETTKRVKAKESDVLTINFFENSFKQLKDSISLFVAEYHGRVIASSIFLHKFNHVHHWFSTSDSEFLNKRPNNLLLYEVLLWAMKKGYEVFHLSSAYENSSLFTFKSSFSEKFVDNYTYKRVHLAKTDKAIEISSKILKMRR